MKLRKIVKHLDNYADVCLYEYNDNARTETLLWEGSMLSLQCAASSKEEIKQYIKECRDDEDYAAIDEVNSCIKYLDWHLDTTDEGEAISILNSKNERRVAIPCLIIYIKPTKK